MQVMTRRIKHVAYLTWLGATYFAHVWCGRFAGKFQTFLPPFVAVGTPVYPAAFCIRISIWHFASAAISPWPLTRFLRLDGGIDVMKIGSDWPSILTFPLPWFLDIRLGTFSMFYACCVGQAANPGPDYARIRFAVANPTAVYGIGYAAEI